MLAEGTTLGPSRILSVLGAGAWAGVRFSAADAGCYTRGLEKGIPAGV
jgi:hypothetical protein